jgi:glycosyltransferase involved in cell wall biosynthesis
MLVSIITPSYNQGAFIEETIRSVLNQSYPHIEYLIVDALSSDGTAQVLERYQGHPGVSLIIREKDRGQADAIAKGFRLARGEIVGWINSDDLLAPDVVEKSVALFRANPRIGLTYGDLVFFGADGKGESLQKPHPFLTREYLLNTDYDVSQPGSFYRKSAVMEAGSLKPGLNYCMDLDLWLGILKTHQAGYLGSTAARFRLHDSAKTANGGLAFLKEIYRTLVLHGARKLPVTKLRIFWYAGLVVVKRVIYGEKR